MIEPQRLLQAMTEIADKFHNQVMQQKRKYNGAPYTVHTEEVAAIYAEQFPQDYIGIAAAKGHDLFEDTPLRPGTLCKELHDHGIDIEDDDVDRMVGTIIELTDVFTPKEFPEINRAQRKKFECDRIAGISPRAKNIKLADLISNTASIVEHDPGFAKTYLVEKWRLLAVLRGENPVLWQRAHDIAKAGFVKLGLTPPSGVL